MKKFIAVMMFFVIITTTFCSCKNSTEVVLDEGYHAKGAVQECSNGWFMFFELGYNLNQEIPTDEYVIVNAVNLKYKNLDDFKIRMIDSETKEVIETIQPEVSYCSMNPQYELILYNLEKTLLAREQNPDLTERELLNFEDNDIFNKKVIMDIYNTALKNGEMTFGKYGDLSESGLKSEDELSGYKWQVGYLLSYANIAALNIELIYSDGTYLSDITKEDMTTNQKELFSIITKIENNIIRNQNFVDIGINSNLEIGNIKLSRLQNLLNTFEEEHNANAENQ